jgi:hypothetical protein
VGNPTLWTGAAAITALRNTVQDPSGAAVTRWADADMAKYLDRAVQRIVADTETAVETSWTAALVDGTREYALPANFFKDKVVEYVKETTDVRRLVYLNREEFEERFARDPTASGEPVYYWYWARKGSDPTTYQTGSIYLSPVPDAVADTKTLRIWGYKVPDSIAADTTKTIELEPVYVEAMLMYAASLVKMDESDLGAQDRFLALYERMSRTIMDNRAQKSKSRISQIRQRDSVLSGYQPYLPWRRPWVG